MDRGKFRDNINLNFLKINNLLFWPHLLATLINRDIFPDVCSKVIQWFCRILHPRHYILLPYNLMCPVMFS